MAWPVGVKTRTVTFGPAYVLEDGTELGMSVSIAASRSLVWNGAALVTSNVAASAAPGETGSIVLPVTDQDGYEDGAGNEIVLGEDGHTHTYTANVSYTLSGRTLSTFRVGPFVLPESGTPADLEKLAVATGVTPILVPIPVVGDPGEPGGGAEPDGIGMNTAVTLVSSEDYIAKVTIDDDGTPSADWPDRLTFTYGGHLTSWFNEYGEFRVIPGKSNTVPFRIYQKNGSSDSRNMAQPLIEVAYSRTDRDPLFLVGSDGSVWTASGVTASGPITREVPGGPTLTAGHLILDEGDPVPAGTPAGTLIVRRPA